MTIQHHAPGSSVQGSSPAVAVIGREAGQWLLARVADGHEASFVLEVDERFWRARRAQGATSSMFEAPIPGPLSAGDLAAAVVRWASHAGVAARATAEDGAFRVTLSRPAD